MGATDPLFDPKLAIAAGRLRPVEHIRQQVLGEGWFPRTKPAGARARKGEQITWLDESDSKLMKFRPDQVVATQGNVFSLGKLGTFADMIRRGEIPFAFVPMGHLDTVSETDVRETQEARPDDLRYDGMSRPFVEEEIGKRFVRLYSGNHRAFAAFMAGEPFIWVAVLGRPNPDVVAIKRRLLS